MMLEKMYKRCKILTVFRDKLTDKGYSNKQLAVISGQISILDDLIQHESFNVMDEILRKTNYRLLKSIDKGLHNLIEIYDNPYDWQLVELEGNNKEWFSDDVLIFSTERQTLVFSKNIDGQKYVNNKWQ
jgi:hypothetical protein